MPLSVPGLAGAFLFSLPASDLRRLSRCHRKTYGARAFRAGEGPLGAFFWTSTRAHARDFDEDTVMRGFFCVSRRVSIYRAVVCPSALAGFKGAAALLPVGVDIRMDIRFVCPPPIRPMASAGRGTGRERGACCFPFTEKSRAWLTARLTV